MSKPVMTVEEVERFLAAEFPQAFHPGAASPSKRSGSAAAACGWPIARNSSAGGTISGPTMMTLSDFALYVAVLAAIGPVALAVTINLNINFLRKPERRDLIAEAKILKLGKRLAVMEVNLFSDGSEEAVAHVTSTYSIPPRAETYSQVILHLFYKYLIYID